MGIKCNAKLLKYTLNKLDNTNVYQKGREDVNG